MAVTIETVAITCHEANRRLQRALGEQPSPAWKKCSEHIRESVRNGVQNALASPVGPEDNHDAWVAFKEADGWVHGEKKDEKAKTHPCLVPYDELPEGQKAKDALFLGIVSAFAPLLEDEVAEDEPEDVVAIQDEINEAALGALTDAEAEAEAASDEEDA